MTEHYEMATPSWDTKVRCACGEEFATKLEFRKHVPTRLYQLHRLRPGDYVCPSNDGKFLWRFRRYWEDGSLIGYVEGTTKEYRIKGWFWEAARTPMPIQAHTAGLEIDEFDDLPWDYMQTLMNTRKQAITVMEGDTTS
jgi:hypothetical protein